MHILADVGGTKTRVTGTVDRETFGEPIIIDTPQRYQDGVEALARAVHHFSGKGEIESMVVGIRGYIDHEKGSTRDKEALLDWSEKPLASDLKEAVQATSIHLHNDALLVGVGEAVYGAGKGAAIVAYITISTGIGGARIVDGQADRFHQGFEPGGLYLTQDARISFEEMISGAAIEKRFGVHPKELRKDNAIWEELAKTAAYGIHNIILLWSPEKVVLGGSMLNEIGISVERVNVHVKEIMRKFPVVPEIAHSSLGDLGGLWGGLALLNQKLS